MAGGSEGIQNEICEAMRIQIHTICFWNILDINEWIITWLDSVIFLSYAVYIQFWWLFIFYINRRVEYIIIYFCRFYKRNFRKQNKKLLVVKILSFWTYTYSIPSILSILRLDVPYLHMCFSHFSEISSMSKRAVQKSKCVIFFHLFMNVKFLGENME